MKPEEKDQIIKALKDRIAEQPCPRCGNEEFGLADGYFNQPLQDRIGGITLGGPTIPSVAVICNKCGFISQHALGALNLLPTPDKKKKDDISQ